MAGEIKSPSKEVRMSKKAFTKEHSHLIKVLRKGSKKEQVTEAGDQASEMKQYRSKKRDTRRSGRG